MKCRTAVFVFVLLAAGVLTKNVRILGGEDADVRTYPFIATFKYIENLETFCGGSIISKRHIIATAQCLFSELKNLENIRAYTGTVFADTHLGTAHEIKKVFPHPRYTGKQNNDEVYLHDIAVIKLKSKIKFNEFQNAIEFLNRDVSENDSGFVLGWGASSYPIISYPLRMQKANMTVVPERDYSNFFNFLIHDTQFCALDKEGVGICMGDSGNPFVIDGKLAGFVSLIRPCAAGTPDIYTKIYYYIDFINDMMYR